MQGKRAILELEKVLAADAKRIMDARTNARLIHRTKDIDAAGDEVEQVVRQVLKRKLPAAYYVGHGHVVDSELTTSPQLDIVIADNFNAPVLFTTENKTEYFPYESVYAVGEVKSCYYKGERYIHAFSETLKLLKTELKREKTERGYLGYGVSVGANLVINQPDEYRNPLFSFIFFVDSGDYTHDDIVDLLRAKPVSQLPNLICFLDKGVVVNAKITRLANGTFKLASIHSHPELDIRDGTDAHWVFIPFGDAESRSWISFGFLYFCLLLHLKRCRLRPPDILQYLNRFFTYDSGMIIS